MRYFDTASYREVANCREYVMGTEMSKHVHRAIVASFLAGAFDVAILKLIGTFLKDNMWLYLLICILFGGVFGYLLFLLWKKIDKEIKHRTKQVYWDIETLTWKIEALQEEYDVEEDYELVGETEKKKDEDN